MQTAIVDSRRNSNIIIAISAVIPVAVAILIFLPSKISAGSWVYVLPDLNAVINGTTSLLLIVAFIMVRKGDVLWHRRLMTAALFLGFFFLLSYIVYHASAPSVKYGDTDHDGLVSAIELSEVAGTRGLYLFVLLSHILLSVVVVPFVLFAFYFALTNRIEKHKKLVKFTLPIWLYVSVTGVCVYLMIRPFYPWY